jgi:PhzF family phenazine biosynthesis protein
VSVACRAAWPVGVTVLLRFLRRRFYQVDVFGSEWYTGNALAVVLDAAGLSTEEMKAFSRWTNLSETTFLLRPVAEGADYKVRIFSLDTEYPFAGHLRLGSCRAWLTSGGQPKTKEQIVQECGAGLTLIRHTDAGLAFAAPPLVAQVLSMRAIW